MIQSLSKILEMLAPSERRGFYLLILLTMVVGLLEMVGIASVFPFMAVLANPDVVQENAWLRWAYTTLGFTETTGFLVFLGFATFAFVILSIFVHVLSLYALTAFGHMRAYSLSTRLLRGYLRQPYAWFLNRHSADLGKVILAEADSVVKEALLPALKLASGLFVALFIVALLVALQPLVAFGVATVLVLAYGAIFVTARRWFLHFGQVRYAANGQRYQIAQEAMGGIKDVKLLGLEESYIRRFQKPARRMAHANSRRDVLGDAPRFLLQGVAFGGMLIVLLVLLVSDSQSLDGLLPLLAVYAFAGLRLLPALQLVYAQLARLRFSQPLVDALHRDLTEIQALDAEARAAPAEAPAAPLRLRARIELVDVRYAYPFAERQALCGLSLAIPAQSTVGIVGGTGAGKTTAVDIMLGLLAPQAGELRVDGQPIGPANLRAWQSTIGYVPQAIFLTDDSVAANIAFGIPESRIDRAAVERAARIAELHDFVTAELPQGYDTFVGERGVRLSGGQRQRIGIARALYHDPDVLIMDEATSALDNLTERAVMDAVANIGRAKTIVLIAHRLSTVRHCDRIFMLEQGRLVAEGAYDELIETSRQFRALAVGHPL